MKYRIGIKTGIALLLAIQLLVLPAAGASAAAPGDLDNHWAKSAITAWMERGLVSGDPDGRFRPDDRITRGELVKLINRAFGYTAKGAVSYKDAVKGKWYYPELEIASAAGYIQGYADGTFGPNRPVLRQELAVMLGKLLAVETKDYDVTFSDSSASPDWSRPAIAMASANGLMSGYPDGTFRPALPLTRAEAVVILDRTLAAVSGQSSVAAIPLMPKQGVFTTAGGLLMGSGELEIVEQGTDNPVTVAVPVENGVFTFPLMKDGTYRIEAYFGKVSRTQMLLKDTFEIKDGVPAGGPLHLTAPPLYTGSLHFASGMAANGYIHVTPLPTDYRWRYTAPLAVDGQFNLYLADGSYLVEGLMESDGTYVSLANKFAVVGGQVSAGSMEIHLPKELSGTLVKADGSAVKSGFIEVWSSDKFGEIYVAMVLDGRFTVHLPDGSYDITYYIAPESKYYPLKLRIEVKDGQAVQGPLKLTLPALPVDPLKN